MANRLLLSRDQNILVVAADDQRLSWPGRELVRQLGKKLYGDIRQQRPAVDSWTVEMVEARLEDAGSVIRRLPPVRVPGYVLRSSCTVARPWLQRAPTSRWPS
jgi:hypothetical protein